MNAVKLVSSKCGRIREWWLTIAGHLVSVRIEPLDFQKDMKSVERVINLGDFDVAQAAIRLAYDQWGDQPDLVRLETYNSFRNEHRDDTES